MKTAQHIFEEWQKLMVAGKSWRCWDDLEQWEKTCWILEEQKTILSA